MDCAVQVLDKRTEQCRSVGQIRMRVEVDRLIRLCSTADQIAHELFLARICCTELRAILHCNVFGDLWLC